jgi:MarR family transcriptional regulator, 2-MHQ and catechol-resistance regulon repressor
MDNDKKAAANAVLVRKLLFILTRMMGRQMEQQLKAHGSGISGLQYGAMRVLYHHHISTLTLSELSRHMELTPATLVPVIDALEREGLLERNRDPKDRRRTLLSLTGRGVQMLDRIPRIDHHNAFVDGLDKLGPEKSEQLALLLRELANHMVASDEKLAQCLPWHPGGSNIETPEEDDDTD